MQTQSLRNIALIVSIMCTSGPIVIAQLGREDAFHRAVEKGRHLAGEAIYQSYIPGILSDLAIGCGRILVADGDSWFNYPLRADIVSALETLEPENWAVFSVAGSGDTLESMMYDNSQLSSFYRILARAFFFHEIVDYDAKDNGYCSDSVPRDAIPKAIILSAGGNDVLGDELSFLLEHADSSVVADDRVNPLLRRGLFYRLERILVEYISAIRRICNDVSVSYVGGDTCNNIPIVIHGYDYAQATGVGYRVLGISFSGPWIRPALDLKDWEMSDGNEAVRTLVNDYNDLLCSVAIRLNDHDTSGSPVFYLDFRESLDEEDWRDEIHPNELGARRLAQEISRVVVDFHNGQLRREDPCNTQPSRRSGE